MMNSKYDGFCLKCKQKIHKGDPIQKDEEIEKWVHVNCPQRYRRHSSSVQQTSKVPGRNVLEAAVATFEEMPAEQQQMQPVITDENVTAGSFSVDWTPSKYQQDIFTFIETGTGNGVVEAVAGSGKTSTLIKLLQIIPKNSTAAFLAFNKHIANELDSRLRSLGVTHVHVSTIHSLGLSLIKKLPEFIGVRNGIDKDKVGGIMDDFWPVSKGSGTDTERKINRMRRAIMRKAVSLAKATLVDVQDGNALMEMFERYGFTIDENIPLIVEKLPYVMGKCLENCETIDYDDMIWLPLVHSRLKNHFDKFMYLFVDEAQDLNNSQIQFVLNSAYKESRILCVGDRSQSLYGFRGADTEAIPRLIEELQATVLPLSISYRCPRSHVIKAKQIVPQIEPSETAVEGKIEDIDYKVFQTMIEPGDMIICRTNAPLVKPAFNAIKNGKKAMIRGADIGAKLISSVEKFNAGTLFELQVLLDQHTEAEYTRLLDRGKELQAEMVKDEADTITTVANSCKTVIELLDKLRMLFSDTNTGVVFSSVHRAKGLEAERVFILRPELMPHEKAKQAWEKVQEQNCLYVALTRSKNELYFVYGDERDG